MKNACSEAIKSVVDRQWEFFEDDRPARRGFGVKHSGFGSVNVVIGAWWNPGKLLEPGARDCWPWIGIRVFTASEDVDQGHNSGDALTPEIKARVVDPICGAPGVQLDRGQWEDWVHFQEVSRGESTKTIKEFATRFVDLKLQPLIEAASKLA